MARKRANQAPNVESNRPAVTAERFRRLYKLIGLLANGPRTRSVLLTALDLDLRGFYRDLALLREIGIPVTLTGQLYALGLAADEARSRLPIPDPHLTLGDAQQIARGRTTTHAKFRTQLDDLTS